MKLSQFELRIQKKHTKHVDRRSKTNVTLQAQVHIIHENQRTISCSQSKREKQKLHNVTDRKI